jgi:hypothetical protein
MNKEISMHICPSAHLVKYFAMKTYRGMEVNSQIHPLAALTDGNSCRYPLYMRLYAVRTLLIKVKPCNCWDRNPGHPVRSHSLCYWTILNLTEPCWITLRFMLYDSKCTVPVIIFETLMPRKEVLQFYRWLQLIHWRPVTGRKHRVQHREEAQGLAC